MGERTAGGAELRDAMKRVAVALKGAGVPFALAGGYAGWARGGPEPDHDVDFVLPQEHLERAAAALRGAGVRVEEPSEDWLIKAYCGDELVDLIHRPAGRPVTEALIERADALDVDSVEMPVIAATDLVAMKLRAMTEHYCDFTGVLPVARALREQIDWAALREEATESPFAAACMLLVEHLGIVPAAAGTA
ncbi:MAG: nucleotidyltransferase family protein [Frankiaceae bacterium]